MPSKRKEKNTTVSFGWPFSEYFDSIPMVTVNPRLCDPRGHVERKGKKKSRMVCIVPTMDRRDPVWHRQGSWGTVQERKKERKESRLTWPSVISDANCALANCRLFYRCHRVEKQTYVFDFVSPDASPSFFVEERIEKKLDLCFRHSDWREIKFQAWQGIKSRAKYKRKRFICNFRRSFHTAGFGHCNYEIKLVSSPESTKLKEI